MLGVDSRAARAAWTVFLVALAIALFYVIRRTLLIFTVALLLAYLMSPLVNMVERLTPGRISRNLALAVVYLALLVLLGAAAAGIGSEVAGQAVTLASRVPDLIQRLEAPFDLPLPEWVRPVKVSVLAWLKDFVQAHSQEILGMLQSAGRQALSLLGNLLFVILVPILSFFILKDGRAIVASLLDWLEAGPRRSLADDILADVNLMLAQFMRALVILCAATFVFYFAFFAIAGVPYGLLLATIAGFLEFIPVIGPLSATAAILVVAGFAGYQHLLWILIFLGAYRLFQDYVLQPYLMGAGVALHPVFIIFGALAGEQIAGVAGLFLSVPVMAILRVVFVRVMKARQPRPAPALS